MTRAEEAALRAYPKEIRDKNGIVIDIGHPQWIRDYYIHGYEQAEKDLALTWEDVKLIVECYNKAADSPSTIQWGLGSDIHCEDALYLYNKKKQAKEINESKTSMSKIGKD